MKAPFEHLSEGGKLGKNVLGRYLEIDRLLCLQINAAFVILRHKILFRATDIKPCQINDNNEVLFWRASRRAGYGLSTSSPWQDLIDATGCYNRFENMNIWRPPLPPKRGGVLNMHQVECGPPKSQALAEKYLAILYVESEECMPRGGRDFNRM